MYKKKIMPIISKLLLAFAPRVAQKPICLGLWGEPEIPESLKPQQKY